MELWLYAGRVMLNYLLGLVVLAGTSWMIVERIMKQYRFKN